MQFIESLDNGTCVNISGSYFIVTSDRKSNGNRMCVSLNSGSIRWIDPSTMVEPIDIFTFDSESNILAIRPREKTNENNAAQN